MRRVLVLAAVLALAACSSSGGKDSAAPATSGTPAPAGATPTAPSSATSLAVVATTAPPAAAGTPLPSATSVPHATTAPGRPAASRATAPGTYTYDSSGSQSTGAYSSPVSGTASLVVSALRGGRQSSTLRNAQGETRQEVLVRDAGSYLDNLRVAARGYPDKEFAFVPAVLLLPDPARVGTRWSWSGTSTDGRTKVSTTNQVTRMETITIGGGRVATVVLQTHLVLSGDLSYTADVTTWVAPSLRLPVKDHTVGKGTAVGVPFSFDVTDVMRSTTPS